MLKDHIYETYLPKIGGVYVSFYETYNLVSSNFMTTMRTLIIVTILTFGQLAVGQTIKTIKPELGGSNDYTKAEEIVMAKTCQPSKN